MKSINYDKAVGKKVHIDTVFSSGHDDVDMLHGILFLNCGE